MKSAINILIAIVLGAMTFASCNEWTETEALNYETNGGVGSSHGDAYYANLREYKKSDHTIAFGWFSDWTGTGTQMTSQLMGLPDSMDLVSMWGNWNNLSPEKKEDLRKVRELKGTKVMMCFIIDHIGAQTTPPEIEETLTVDGETYQSIAEARAAFWGWYQDSESYWEGSPHYGDSSPEGIEKAIRKYARSILDTVRKYQWDGFDFDLEPSSYGGNISKYPDRISILLDELSKELGPQSGTGKLLCVDGAPETVKGKDSEKLDYFIFQAYGDSGYEAIDQRIDKLFSQFRGYMSQEEIVHKTILCANFESYGSTGGGNLVDRDGIIAPRIVSYAAYSYPGVDAKIGGFGAYRIGFDPGYQYTRQAIGVANPVIK